MAKLPEHTGINDNIIKLKTDMQLLLVPIYSLGLIKLEILKTYIKTNLTHNFIRISKSPIRVTLFFD